MGNNDRLTDEQRGSRRVGPRLATPYNSGIGAATARAPTYSGARRQSRDIGGVSLVTRRRYPGYAGGSGSLHTREPCRISLLRVELLNRQHWWTRIELANAIFDYLEIVHTRQRRHTALRMRTPTIMVFVGLRRWDTGGRHADFGTHLGDHASVEPDRTWPVNWEARPGRASLEAADGSRANPANDLPDATTIQPTTSPRTESEVQSSGGSHQREGTQYISTGRPKRLWSRTSALG